MKEMNKKIEIWINYKSDEFFDEILTEEVKIEEKSWDQFSSDKEHSIDMFTNTLFTKLLKESITVMSDIQYFGF